MHNIPYPPEHHGAASYHSRVFLGGWCSGLNTTTMQTPRVLSIEDDEDLLDPDTRHVQRSLEVGTIPETEYFDGPTDHDHADEDMGS